MIAPATGFGTDRERSCPLFYNAWLRHLLSDPIRKFPAPPLKFLTQPTTLIFGATAIVSGALLLWTTLSNRNGSRAITPLQTTQLINAQNAIVMDVREADEFAAGSITGARNVPLSDLKARLADLARFKNRPVVLVCATGQRSGGAVRTVTEGGFTEVYNLSGGLNAWREAGLPIVKIAAKEGGRRDK